MLRRLLALLIFFLLSVQEGLMGQYPQYFTYSDENGMPNNEVYSILQDERGFIWFGSDAGIYKFDGIRHHHYKSPDQKSKSITGLNLSVNGRIYCHNFQSQIFYLEDDELIELKHPYSAINSIVTDKKGNLLVTHGNGFSVYNEESKTWKNESLNPPPQEDPFRNITRSVRVNSKSDAAFITTKGVGIFSDNKYRYFDFKERKDRMTENFTIEWYNEEPWVFSFSGSDEIYKITNKGFEPVLSKNLKSLLKNTQITRVKQLSDGYLWICTYNGTFRYNPEKDKADIFYPDMAFSDCMIDREGNYWLTSLQFGMLRIPNLDYIVWNDFKRPKLSKLTSGGSNIYFSTVNSELGILNTKNNQIKIFPTGHKSDIQALNFIDEDKKAYFFTYKNLFSLDETGTEQILDYSGALKHIQKFSETYFLSESSGLITRGSFNSDETKKISHLWTRETAVDPKTETIWAATNDGVLKIMKKDDWVVTDNLLLGNQILSLSFNSADELLYVLSFDGTILSITRDLTTKIVGNIPPEDKGYRLRYHNGKLYTATNRGVYIHDIKTGNYQVMSTHNGLASNNVTDLLIQNNNLWIATGNGLEKIPLTLDKGSLPAIVYVKNKIPNTDNIILKKDVPLTLYPETSFYSAGDKYEYAYKLNENDWVRLPAEIEKIELLNIPAGNFKLLLKTIDHQGMDSENILKFSGYIKAPYWESPWFTGLALMFTVATIIFFANRIIQSVKKEEQRKNELLQSQLKAIRAQMNPHFMYNTLNSIQDLILQKDIKSSNYYLTRFSGLMRQILDFSREERILLSEEINMLENYLKLEKLRMGDDFEYNINMDEDLDPERTYLPSLLIQPFVENSLKHGLLHKKGVKKLDINFTKDANTLKINILDNGIGKKRSDEIQKKNPLKHKSFAGEASHKRVELLNSSGKFNIEIDTTNLNEDETNPGTRVDITILTKTR